MDERYDEHNIIRDGACETSSGKGKIEGMHLSVEHGIEYLGKSDMIKDASEKLDGRVEFCNVKSPRRSLGYQCPFRRPDDPSDL